MSSNSLRIAEYDEAENQVALYVQSECAANGLSRVDVIPPLLDVKSLLQKTIDVFLPVGYPHSVTDDYLEYQIYDSLQAFSSSIASLLSSRAVLDSIGVGDSKASSTTALLFSILQDSAGRLATILFAHRFGTSLEPECKMYRLLADVLNDTGFVLNCLSPVFPKSIRVTVLSFSSILRSLCGVAAGSSKASLSAHFAKQGNLGELNAKDSSQETVISLVGMLVGSWVITWVTTPFAVWTSMILLLSIHLETNRRAVRAVKMHTLTRQRATIVFNHLQKERVPTPGEVASEERIFERDGVLRGNRGQILGHCNVGAPLSRLMSALSTSQQQTATKAVRVDDKQLHHLLALYDKSSYILWCDRNPRPGKSRLFIILKKDAGARDMLTAWWQALSFARDLTTVGGNAKQEEKEEEEEFTRRLELARGTLDQAKSLLSKFREPLQDLGWNLELSALETVAGRRVAIENS